MSTLHLTLIIIGALLLACLAAFLVVAWRELQHSQLDDYDRALAKADGYAARAQRVADAAMRAGRLPNERERQAIDYWVSMREMAMREARAARGGEELTS